MSWYPLLYSVVYFWQRYMSGRLILRIRLWIAVTYTWMNLKELCLSGPIGQLPHLMLSGLWDILTMILWVDGWFCVCVCLSKAMAVIVFLYNKRYKKIETTKRKKYSNIPTDVERLFLKLKNNFYLGKRGCACVLICNFYLQAKGGCFFFFSFLYYVEEISPILWGNFVNVHGLNLSEKADGYVLPHCLLKVMVSYSWHIGWPVVKLRAPHLASEKLYFRCLSGLQCWGLALLGSLEKKLLMERSLKDIDSLLL